MSLQTHRQCCTSHKKRVREPIEKTREYICLHSPAKLSAQSGQKRKTTPLRRPSTDRRTCLVSAQNLDDVSSLSHWTLHDVVLHSARFSAHRQLMPCFTSAALPERLAKTTQKTFSEPVREQKHPFDFYT